MEDSFCSILLYHVTKHKKIWNSLFFITESVTINNFHIRKSFHGFFMFSLRDSRLFSRYQLHQPVCFYPLRFLDLSSFSSKSSSTSFGCFIFLFRSSMCRKTLESTMWTTLDSIWNLVVHPLKSGACVRWIGCGRRKRIDFKSFSL